MTAPPWLAGERPQAAGGSDVPLLVGRRSIPLHDLRHAQAANALRADIPTKVVDERLGHDMAAFTTKQAAHVIPGALTTAAT